jgi:hypothetical protein
MRYKILLGCRFFFRVGVPVFLFFKRERPVGPVGMWESRAAFWRDFPKRRWESALFADFRGRVISIRPNHARFYPQIPLKTQK